MNKNIFFFSIAFLCLSACGGAPPPSVPIGQPFQQPQSGFYNSVILLCECENDKHHVMGKGESHEMAKKSAQSKCQLFSSDYSIKNCKNMQ